MQNEQSDNTKMNSNNKRKREERKKRVFKNNKKQEKKNDDKWWTAEGVYRMVNILDEDPNMTWLQLQNKMKNIDEYEKSCNFTEEEVRRAKQGKKRRKEGYFCFC